MQINVYFMVKLFGKRCQGVTAVRNEYGYWEFQLQELGEEKASEQNLAHHDRCFRNHQLNQSLYLGIFFGNPGKFGNCLEKDSQMPWSKWHNISYPVLDHQFWRLQVLQVDSGAFSNRELSFAVNRIKINRDGSVEMQFWDSQIIVKGSRHNFTLCSNNSLSWSLTHNIVERKTPGTSNYLFVRNKKQIKSSATWTSC